LLTVEAAEMLRHQGRERRRNKGMTAPGLPGARLLLHPGLPSAFDKKSSAENIFWERELEMSSS
jgi:hypothetical protein